ncbi:hypothetical protein [Thiohalospira halophila]|uniref:hypothetical protein n=1 Tax=Thiohalospira halophila TaxID=381300 RepID=UPI00117CC8B0|nr:hypothetical protein [Thiohalospira halophila]
MKRTYQHLSDQERAAIMNQAGEGNSARSIAQKALAAMFQRRAVKLRLELRVASKPYRAENHQGRGTSCQSTKGKDR